MPAESVLLACALLAAALSAPAHLARADALGNDVRRERAAKIIGVPDARGCMYEGRWFAEGAAVRTREACLRCACAHGALSCHRRACAALPDPPPRRCHVLHKKGACCPELHCPDGVKVMEHGPSARFENDDLSDIVTPASIIHACVEGGNVYSAGSAMGSGVACEQCFCLRGARRCVRPACLPPPAACRARPAPGACCPPRYYCDRPPNAPPGHKRAHDCEVNSEVIPEGERVPAAERAGNCTQCFCLRGAVHCQPLACALPLLGCQPLLRPGECCPHQYHCDHKPQGVFNSIISDNSISPTRYDDRSLHTDKQTDKEATTNAAPISSTVTNTPPAAATKIQSNSTTKVKRKTNDPPPTSTSTKPVSNETSKAYSTTRKPATTTKKLEYTATEISTTETVERSTDQPEGTIKIMINGTINCTAELSSTSIPLNISLNDTEKIKMEGHLRNPTNKIDIEAFIDYPNDIITEGIGDFDENESFTINVTSSLRTNNSHSSSAPSLSTTAKIPVSMDTADVVNTSKKSKGDYDYDYTEPTLPPSLPNLKIIPFVAADAVVEDDTSSKEETLTYPMLEREDKFPIYYPALNAKDIQFATRREDPIQYPIFTSEKVELPKYPNLVHDSDLGSLPYPSAPNDLKVHHDYTSSTLIASNIQNLKAVTKTPEPSSTFALETPSVNLFSPPIETEGGFIPKGPGLIEEYYAVYPSTPPGPPVPHLTTSMQLDVSKGECVSSDGRHVLEGDSISIACSICTCAWGDLHCSPRHCLLPPGCTRRPATSSSVDLCCGELICDQGLKVTSKPNLLIDIKANESEVPAKDEDTSNLFNVMTVNQTSNDNNTNKSDEIRPFNIVTNDSISLTTRDETTIKIEPTIPMETPGTLKPTTPSTTVTVENIILDKDSNYTSSESQEYEDEEDDDEGFSFGNVLKLLLSDNYETTTQNVYKKPTTYPPKHSTTLRHTTTTIAPTTKRLPPKPPLFPFIPMPLHPYVPPKKSYTQNTVNRIDHLVLGEATAIKKTTPRPISTPIRPTVSYKPVTTRSTTHRPFVPNTVATRKQEETTQHSPIPHEIPRPGSSALPLPGILKLAGCNIYGRMYRVGRIITELSTPCQECWCTELGVQCNSLKC